MSRCEPLPRPLRRRSGAAAYRPAAFRPSSLRRFSPGSTHFSHALDPEYAKRRGKSGATIPGTPQCQVLGFGSPPPNHYGLPDDVVIERADHRKMSSQPLSDEELAAGHTRLMQLHFDGALYAVPPPYCGSLLAVRTPKGDDLTLRFDNSNGRGEKKIAPGSTAYFDASQAYGLLSPEQKALVDNSTVTYAPHAFTWIAPTKFSPDGASIVSEGKEVPLDDLPPWEEEKLKAYPMVWHNDLTGEKALMVHGQCAMRLHLKRSPEDEAEEVTDLAAVRAILTPLMSPVLRPEYVYAHNHQEGDLAVWYNRGMWHSITEVSLSKWARCEGIPSLTVPLPLCCSFAVSGQVRAADHAPVQPRAHCGPQVGKAWEIVVIVFCHVVGRHVGGLGQVQGCHWVISASHICFIRPGKGPSDEAFHSRASRAANLAKRPWQGEEQR